MTKSKISKAQQNFPAEYEQGRRARLAAVGKEDAPYQESEQLDAWLAGYGDDADPYGAAARDETMEPAPKEAKSQLDTVASSKKP